MEKNIPFLFLTEKPIENEIRNNPEKANREYYNQFTQDGGVGQIIKRALIVRNSYNRPPVLSNDTNTRKFVFAYDPAVAQTVLFLVLVNCFMMKKKGIQWIS